MRSVAVDPSNTWFCTGSADRTIKVKKAYLENSISKKGIKNLCGALEMSSFWGGGDSGWKWSRIQFLQR